MLLEALGIFRAAARPILLSINQLYLPLTMLGVSRAYARAALYALRARSRLPFPPRGGAVSALKGL